MQLNEHVFYGKQLIVRRREKMHSTNKPSTKCASSLCSEEFFSGLDKCNSVRGFFFKFKKKPKI